MTSRHAPLLFTITVLGLIALPRVARSQDAKPEPDVIVTAGEGVVRVAPDQAFVSITAESHAKTPREAQRLNAEAMTAVTQKLKAAGFAGEAIRTLQVQLSPQYDYANGKQTLR